MKEKPPTWKMQLYFDKVSQFYTQLCTLQICFQNTENLVLYSRNQNQMKIFNKEPVV